MKLFLVPLLLLFRFAGGERIFRNYTFPGAVTGVNDEYLCAKFAFPEAKSESEPIYAISFECFADGAVVHHVQVIETNKPQEEGVRSCGHSPRSESSEEAIEYSIECNKVTHSAGLLQFQNTLMD